MNVPQTAPINHRARLRQSSDACWPLRCSDGRTFAERATAPSDPARSNAASTGLPDATRASAVDARMRRGFGDHHG